MKKQINTELSAKELNSALQAVTTIREKLRFLVRLTADKKKSLVMMDNGHAPFTEKAIDYDCCSIKYFYPRIVILILIFITFLSCNKSNGNGNGNGNVPPDTTYVETKQIIIHAKQIDGNNDVERLKYLASGVGWEFSPNSKTTSELKRIGIKTIRGINIELTGEFGTDSSFIISNASRLDRHLTTCRELGATPHLCIGLRLPEALRAGIEDLPDSLRGQFGNQMSVNEYGPTSWKMYRNYFKAYFKYVLIDQGFPNARFEIGNEPDIGGSIFVPLPPKPSNGSKAAYNAYLNLYRNVSQAAAEFEQEHPGIKVRIGGPDLTPFTFKYGDFLWHERFIKDVGEQKLKCDFISMHYYGNNASQYGEYLAPYPTFVDMLNVLKATRNQYIPETPIWITEWGPSFHTDNSLEARINANHMGAAWAAAFLSTMLREHVDGALFLVTTDNIKENSDGILENIWGWPSLFVNPTRFGGNAYPKALFHVFDMVSHLSGQRVAVESPKGSPGVFSCFDAERGSVKVMLWNYKLSIPENELPTDNSNIQAVNLQVKELPETMLGKTLTIRRWQISENESNAVAVFDKGMELTAENTALSLIETTQVQSMDASVSYSFSIPQSGVCLVEFSVSH